MRDLPWDDFRLVKAIADTGTLAGAAERLKVNHSTVFRRLAQIEERLGAPVFERHRTGYLPTPAGEEMVRLAEEMDDRVHAFALKLAGQVLQPAGELKITTNDTLMVHLLMPVFAGFRAQCRDIRLDVVIGNQALNLSKRDADIAIRATDNPPENLVGRRVATIAWAIYGRAADFPRAPGEMPEPAELARREWVSLGDNLAHLRAARHVREQVRPEGIALCANTVLGLGEAVQAGIGVGPLPCFIADRLAGLVRLSQPFPEFATGLWLLTHPDLRGSPRVRAFLDYAAKAFARLKPLIEGERPAGA
jgi:DNA-binding transcriptional LysR family regulator